MIQYEPWSYKLVREMAQKACEGVFTCLELEVSGRCPYNCVYCESPHHYINSSLNLKKACEFIDTKQFKWIYICGIGEPTYDCNEQQLLKILETCKKNNVKCSIFTNLSNLSDQLIDYINDGILYLAFKLDSHSEEIITELYNPVNISDHIVNIQRIENFVKCDDNTTNIAASIVPTKYNIDEIPNLVEWCLERNIFPLVAQLEYAGLAIENYEKLFLDNDALCKLKEKINSVIGEEYNVPFCPAVFAGINITYDNKITIDRRTGLSCHSFWLDEPDLEIVCDNINDQTTIDDITEKIINVRTSLYKDFISNKDIHKEYIFGGCGGNKEDIFKLYIEMMETSFYSHPANKDYININRFVYLDNNATTKISDSVFNSMLPFLKEKFANPNSKNDLGLFTRNAINKARCQIAEAIGANSDEVYFTSSGSEANSWAIYSCLNHVLYNNKNIILSTAIEHPSVLAYLNMLKKHGYIIVNLPLTKHGEIDVDLFIDRFTQWGEVAFASIMLVNNETGVINDINRISQVLHGYNIYLHCDAVQALGKLRISVNDLDVDYLSISGHKIYAPKGIGALYVRRNRALDPLVLGHQENEKRGGTENTAFIVAFGQAISDIYSNHELSFIERIDHIASLRDKIEKSIPLKYKPIFIGKGANRVANTSNIGFYDFQAIRLKLLLEQRGIYISNGAACNPKDSHVLKAMSSPAYNNGSLRISLSEYTEDRDIDYFIVNLLNSLKKMKGE